MADEATGRSDEVHNEIPKSDLELENESLRQRLKALESTELFLEARKKFLHFIATAVVIITAFGVVSVKSLTASVRDQIEDNVVDSMIAEVKADLVRSYSVDIERQVSAQLSEAIASRIQIELLRLAKEAIGEAEKDSQADFAGTVVRSYRDQLFYVVVSSSTDVPALHQLGERYKESISARLAELSLGFWLCESPDNPNWGLALGPPMALEEVQGIVGRAREIGIPLQSYPGRASRLACEKLESVKFKSRLSAANLQHHGINGAATE